MCMVVTGYCVRVTVYNNVIEKECVCEILRDKVCFERVQACELVSVALWLLSVDLRVPSVFERRKDFMSEIATSTLVCECVCECECEGERETEAEFVCIFTCVDDCE